MKEIGDKHPSSGEFSEQIEAVKTCIERLSQLAEGNDPKQSSLYHQLFEELGTILEELNVAEGELRQQNIELALTRGEVEAEKQRYQGLFEFAPDPYLITDQAGVILEANQAAGRLLNAHPGSLVRKPLASFFLLEDRKAFRQKLSQVSNAPYSSNKIDDWEIRLNPRKGDPFFVSFTAAAYQDFRIDSELAVTIRWLIRDMRERRRNQEELKELRRKLADSRERDRQQLALLIHEGPVQDLYGIIYQLILLEQSPGDDSSKEIARIIHTQLEKSIDTLRSVCGELRPPTLVPFGLQKAIASHAGEFREAHSSPKIYLQLAPDGVSLIEEVRLALFRIYQQAISNVLRHAWARNVWVHFYFNDERIVLEIEDDGVGFEVPENWVGLVREGHFGLADATERAEAIGGSLEVISKPGQGTLVRCTVERGS